MNFYPRHLGDYSTAAGHLSLLEHGTYTRLLDTYYAREGPIPADQAARLIGARSGEELAALESVLNEFFVLQNGKWSQARCDAEIERFHEKQRKATASANARWRVGESQCDGSADAMRSHCEGNAPNNQKPRAKIEDSPDGLLSTAAPPTIPDCPHRQIIALYGRHLPTLAQPRPELWGGEAATALRARWRWLLTARRENGEPYARDEDEGLAWFGRFFESVSASDFLSGRSGKFNASLQWLVKAGNFSKVIAGNYSNREAT